MCLHIKLISAQCIIYGKLQVEVGYMIGLYFDGKRPPF
jgi:hypothetical protein